MRRELDRIPLVVRGGMAELADASDLKSEARKGVRVRSPVSPPPRAARPVRLLSGAAVSR